MQEIKKKFKNDQNNYSENISGENVFKIVSGALSGTTGAALIAGTIVTTGLFVPIFGGLIGGLITGYSVYNKIKKEQENHKIAAQ